MSRFFRWITEKRNVAMLQSVVEIERRRIGIGDALKVIGVLATAVWATATAATRLSEHGQKLDDHESRIRQVEMMQPQVQAIYAVIVEGKRSGVHNPR